MGPKCIHTIACVGGKTLVLASVNLPIMRTPVKLPLVSHCSHQREQLKPVPVHSAALNRHKVPAPCSEAGDGRRLDQGEENLPRHHVVQSYAINVHFVTYPCKVVT